MTEVEFEKVRSITTSLKEIAKQLAISNKLKLEELRIRGLPQEETQHYRMMIEGWEVR